MLSDFVSHLQGDRNAGNFFSSVKKDYGSPVDIREVLSELEFESTNQMAKVRSAMKRLSIDESNLTKVKKSKYVHWYLPPAQAYTVIECVVRTGLVYDYGFNDVSDTIYNTDGRIKPCYRKWCGMLERCYSPKWHKNKPSYKDCFVSKEWLLFSNFKAWFDEHNREGCVLDKDILFKGNKEYSEKTCVFVPEFINSLFIKRQGDRGDLPIGVHYSKRHKVYIARISARGKRIEVGKSDCPQKAFLAYKKAKEEFIQSTALDYFNRGEIGRRVYDALCAYEVEVDD